MTANTHEYLNGLPIEYCVKSHQMVLQYSPCKDTGNFEQYDEIDIALSNLYSRVRAKYLPEYHDGSFSRASALPGDVRLWLSGHQLWIVKSVADGSYISEYENTETHVPEYAKIFETASDARKCIDRKSLRTKKPCKKFLIQVATSYYAAFNKRTIQSLPLPLECRNAYATEREALLRARTYFEEDDIAVIKRAMPIDVPIFCGARNLTEEARWDAFRPVTNREV
jgi:hypothetical protein